MFQKYNDTPAAICLGIYFLGGIFYVFQLLFMTETWLAGEEIGPEAIGVARVLGFAFLGYNVGLIWTYVTVPMGRKFILSPCWSHKSAPYSTFGTSIYLRKR